MIRVNGVLNGIEEDLFKSFKFLKNIDFQINNFKEFFQIQLENVGVVQFDSLGTTTLQQPEYLL